MDVYEQADLYGAAFDWPVDDEVDWLLDVVGDATSVLEPFCGNARFGPAFVARGVRYWGLDLESAMLARAKRVDGMTLLRADARDFTIEDGPAGGFGLAWCPINSITHLREEDDVLAHLACVHRHLRPGGAYVFEMEVLNRDGENTRPPDDKSVWSMEQPDGSVVRACWRAESYDFSTRLYRQRATFWREHDGERIEESDAIYDMRMWTFEDLLRLTKAGGFQLERAFHNAGSKGRPEVPLTEALENTEQNYYFLLQRRPA